MHSRSSLIILVLAVAVIVALGVRIFPVVHAVEFSYSPESGLGIMVDLSKILRERHKAERAEQLKLYEQQTEGVKLDFWERCSKQGHLCSEGVGTDGTRRTELSPWVEAKNDASNLTFGWADEVAVNATSRRDQSGPALQYYSGTGQDVPINRHDASK